MLTMYVVLYFIAVKRTKHNSHRVIIQECYIWNTLEFTYKHLLDAIPCAQKRFSASSFCQFTFVPILSPSVLVSPTWLCQGLCPVTGVSLRLFFLPATTRCVLKTQDSLEWHCYWNKTDLSASLTISSSIFWSTWTSCHGTDDKAESQTQATAAGDRGHYRVSLIQWSPPFNFWAPFFTCPDTRAVNSTTWLSFTWGVYRLWGWYWFMDVALTKDLGLEFVPFQWPLLILDVYDHLVR